MIGFLVLSRRRLESVRIGGMVVTIEKIDKPFCLVRVYGSDGAATLTLCRDRVQCIAPGIELMPTGFPDSSRVSLGIRAPKGVEIMRSEIDVCGPSPLQSALPAAKALIGGGK